MLKTADFETLTNEDLIGLIGTVVVGSMRPVEVNDPELVRFAGTVTGIQIADGARRAGIDMVASNHTEGNTVSWDRDQYCVTLGWTDEAS